MPDNSMPRVEGGKLTKPYPINSMADVSRARVLPPPRTASRSASTPAKAARPADAGKPAATDDDAAPSGDERAKSGFDYVARRNRMMKGISSSRTVKRSSSRRT